MSSFKQLVFAFLHRSEVCVTEQIIVAHHGDGQWRGIFFVKHSYTLQSPSSLLAIMRPEDVLELLLSLFLLRLVLDA
jgi:hypothetical protein